MAAVRAVALISALAVLAASPCLIAWLIVHVDDLADKASDVVERLPGRDHEPQPRGRSIELIAADMRRLSAELLVPSSALRHEAVQVAYDHVLREACRALDVPQHMDSLVGVDMEIERVRVQGELERAGLVPRALGRPRNR